MGLWKYAYHSSLQKCKLKLQWAIITLSLEELELKRQTIAVTDRYIVLLHFSCECTLENSNNFFKSYTYPSHTLTDSIPRYLSKKYGNIRLPLYLKSRFIHNTPELERIDAFINIWIATQIVIQVSFTFQKFALQHFTLMKCLHSYLISRTERNPKRMFTFTTEDEKRKLRPALVLQQPL